VPYAIRDFLDPGQCLNKVIKYTFITLIEVGFNYFTTHAVYKLGTHYSHLTIEDQYGRVS